MLHNGNAELQHNKLVNALLDPLAVEPAPTASRFFYDTTSKYHKISDDGVDYRQAFSMLLYTIVTDGGPLMLGGYPDRTACLMQSNGSLWSWGYNESGQLGDNTTTYRSSPVSVVGSHSFVRIACGLKYSLALKSNGSLWACGANEGGTWFNSNSSIGSSSPTSTGQFFSYIACGEGNSYALKTDGTAWACGYNSYGQLGDGTRNQNSSPISVVGNHSFISICSGTMHVHAIKTDGSLWSWGYSINGGMAGDGQRIDRSSPVSVLGGGSYIQVCAGGGHIIALRSDGTVWGWGQNNTGAIGDNTISPRSSPVSVVGNHSFVKISAAYVHSMGLKSDGSCWVWGQGYYGEMGDNTTSARHASPTSIVGGHSFIAISGGYEHLTALKADGSLWAWGRNQFGALGNGTTDNRSSPISVAKLFI